MEDQSFMCGTSSSVPIDEYMRNVKFEVKEMEQRFKRKKENEKNEQQKRTVS